VPGRQRECRPNSESAAASLTCGAIGALAISEQIALEGSRYSRGELVTRQKALAACNAIDNRETEGWRVLC